VRCCVDLTRHTRHRISFCKCSQKRRNERLEEKPMAGAKVVLWRYEVSAGAYNQHRNIEYVKLSYGLGITAASMIVAQTMVKCSVSYRKYCKGCEPSKPALLCTIAILEASNQTVL
jgi:hypothetical protein